MPIPGQVKMYSMRIPPPNMMARLIEASFNKGRSAFRAMCRECTLFSDNPFALAVKTKGSSATRVIWSLIKKSGRASPTSTRISKGNTMAGSIDVTVSDCNKTVTSSPNVSSTGGKILYLKTNQVRKYTARRNPVHWSPGRQVMCNLM
jgi:hypothetical protein